MPFSKSPGEDQTAFMQRCMHQYYKKEGKPYNEALGVCMSTWKRKEEASEVDQLNKILARPDFETWVKNTDNENKMLDLCMIVFRHVLPPEANKGEGNPYHDSSGKFTHGGAGNITFPRGVDPTKPMRPGGFTGAFGIPPVPEKFIEALQKLFRKQKLNPTDKKALVMGALINLPKIADMASSAIVGASIPVFAFMKLKKWIAGSNQESQKSDLSYFDVKELSNLLGIPEDDVEDFVDNPDNLDLLSTTKRAQVEEVISNKADPTIPDSMPNLKRFVEIMSMDKDKFYEWMTGNKEHQQELWETTKRAVEEAVNYAEKRDYVRDARGRFSQIAESATAQAAVATAQDVASVGSSTAYAVQGTKQIAQWLGPKIAPKISAKVAVSALRLASTAVKIPGVGTALAFIPGIGEIALAFMAADIALNVVGPMVYPLVKDKFMSPPDAGSRETPARVPRIVSQKVDHKLRSSKGRFDTWKGSLNRLPTKSAAPSFATSLFQSKSQEPIDLDSAVRNGDLPLFKKALDVLQYKGNDYEDYFADGGQLLRDLLDRALKEVQDFVADRNKYDPDQPRGEAGSGKGGQFVSTGGPGSQGGRAGSKKKRGVSEPAPAPPEVTDTKEAKKIKATVEHVSWWVQTVSSIFTNASIAWPYVAAIAGAIYTIYAGVKHRRKEGHWPSGMGKGAPPPPAAPKASPVPPPAPKAPKAPKAAKPKAPPKPKKATAPKKEPTPKPAATPSEKPKFPKMTIKVLKKKEDQMDAILPVSVGYGYKVDTPKLSEEDIMSGNYPSMQALMEVIDNPDGFQGTPDEFEQVCQAALEEVSQANKADWNEGKHPRGKGGKFAPKGGYASPKIPAGREVAIRQNPIEVHKERGKHPIPTNRSQLTEDMKRVNKKILHERYAQSRKDRAFTRNSRSPGTGVPKSIQILSGAAATVATIAAVAYLAPKVSEKIKNFYNELKGKNQEAKKFDRNKFGMASQTKDCANPSILLTGPSFWGNKE